MDNIIKEIEHAGEKIPVLHYPAEHGFISAIGEQQIREILDAKVAYVHTERQQGICNQPMYWYEYAHLSYGEGSRIFPERVIVNYCTFLSKEAMWSDVRVRGMKVVEVA